VAALAGSTALRGPSTTGPAGFAELTDAHRAASLRRPPGQLVRSASAGAAGSWCGHPRACLRYGRGNWPCPTAWGASWARPGGYRRRRACPLQSWEVATGQVLRTLTGAQRRCLRRDLAARRPPPGRRHCPRQDGYAGRGGGVGLGRGAESADAVSRAGQVVRAGLQPGRPAPRRRGEDRGMHAWEEATGREVFALRGHDDTSFAWPLRVTASSWSPAARTARCASRTSPSSRARERKVWRPKGRRKKPGPGHTRRRRRMGG
jgi:hypothetical protein